MWFMCASHHIGNYLVSFKNDELVSEFHLYNSNFICKYFHLVMKENFWLFYWDLSNRMRSMRLQNISRCLFNYILNKFETENYNWCAREDREDWCWHDQRLKNWFHSDSAFFNRIHTLCPLQTCPMETTLLLSFVTCFYSFVPEILPDR